MIFQETPKDFSPRFEVASCFLEFDGKFLLLHRHDSKPEGNKWGVPAGKIEAGEKPDEAIFRELKEETGIKIPKNEISCFGKVFVKYPDFDFVHYIFNARLSKPEKVEISKDEHKGFKWVSPKQALKLPLVKDEEACIKLCYKI